MSSRVSPFCPVSILAREPVPLSHMYRACCRCDPATMNSPSPENVHFFHCVLEREGEGVGRGNIKSFHTCVHVHNVLAYSQDLAAFAMLRPPLPCSSWFLRCRTLVSLGQMSWPENCCTKANSTIVTVLSVHATEQNAEQNKAMHLGLPLGLTYLPLLANSMDFTAVADDPVNLNDFKI